VIDYADIRVLETPALPSLALLQDPMSRTPRSADLAIVHSSFSSAWQASPKGKHVLVDGLLNGWLLPLRSHDFSASYEGGKLFQTAEWMSLGALPICGVLLLWSAIRRLLNRILLGLGLKRNPS